MAHQDENEELENNTFFKGVSCIPSLNFWRTLNTFVDAALKLRCPDIYKLAAEQQMVICVPCQMSLVGLALNRTNFEMHVIKPSPFFAGVYETIDGKLLDFEVNCCISPCVCA